MRLYSAESGRLARQREARLKTHRVLYEINEGEFQYNEPQRMWETTRKEGNYYRSKGQLLWDTGQIMQEWPLA